METRLINTFFYQRAQKSTFNLLLIYQPPEPEQTQFWWSLFNKWTRTRVGPRLGFGTSASDTWERQWTRHFWGVRDTFASSSLIGPRSFHQLFMESSHESGSTFFCIYFYTPPAGKKKKKVSTSSFPQDPGRPGRRGSRILTGRVPAAFHFSSCQHVTQLTASTSVHVWHTQS